eukprot:GFUD01055659.1.p1 GENE.GFUD01055659.1~~GFUD01055659.1.p1  ORF type:complete len:124 (+),score=10.32 GFUD01055659.1:2-373(+)
MQSKLDTKKLELGETKCFKIHVGSNEYSCPSLKLHDMPMLSSTKEKYLGDIIIINAKIVENIKMGYDKGTGVSNQVMGILKEVSFGIDLELIIMKWVYYTETQCSLMVSFLTMNLCLVYLKNI